MTQGSMHSSNRCYRRPHGLFRMRIYQRGAFRSVGLPQQRSAIFFPRRAAVPRANKKIAHAVLRTGCGPSAAAPTAR